MATGPRRLRPARYQLLVLLGLGLLVLGAGIGLRDPWPPDEPRYALVGSEMAETGSWLLPHRNGELYADKPPVFFWMIGAAYVATGSPRVSFLLPSLLAGLGTLVLVSDLARRVWGRRAGFLAGLALLASVQFALQARSGQIDAVLAMWTTLALYGLLRHLLLGPAWGWWYVAFAAMGLGVLTKGVGFLPLLVLLPWWFARRQEWRGMPRFAFPAWHAAGGPLVMLVVIGGWVGPVLWAAAADPAIAAYRDEILLRQTATRYAAAWHHRRWLGYYLVQVLPVAWLPLTLLSGWIVPAWRRRLARRDARVLLPFAWVALVLLFFTLSPGKRGVYVLPALPALILAGAPLLPGIVALRRVRGLIWTVLVAVSMVLLTAAATVAAVPISTPRLETLGLDLTRLTLPSATLGVIGLALAGVGRRRSFVGLGAFIVAGWLVAGWWVEPMLNATRSSAPFMREVGRQIGASSELGMLGWQEELVLFAGRPVTTFGFSRPDGATEERDGSAWLLAAANRRLLLPEERLDPCFDRSRTLGLGRLRGTAWYLAGTDAVRGPCRSPAAPKETPAQERRSSPR